MNLHKSFAIACILIGIAIFCQVFTNSILDKKVKFLDESSQRLSKESDKLLEKTDLLKQDMKLIKLDVEKIFNQFERMGSGCVCKDSDKCKCGEKDSPCQCDGKDSSCKCKPDPTPEKPQAKLGWWLYRSDPTTMYYGPVDNTGNPIVKDGVYTYFTYKKVQ